MESSFENWDENRLPKRLNKCIYESATQREIWNLKAAVLHQNEPILKIEDVDSPKLDNGEALVQVKSAGLCRTDLKFMHGVMKPPSYPHILGHEIAGTVVESKPANQRDNELLEEIRKVGNRALVYFFITCGRCTYCRTGRTNLCLKLRRPGFELNGGYSEYVKIPIQNLLPTTLDFDAAVLTDAGATMLHALRRINAKPGTRVTIVGIGGLGGFAVQLAKFMGYYVDALDVDDRKIEFAKDLGADSAINISNLSIGDIKNKLHSIDSGPIEVFVDLVGTRRTQPLALALIVRDGKILQVGWSEDSFADVPLRNIVHNELQIVGSLASTMSDLADLAELTRHGHVRLDIAKRYPLDQINAALKEMENYNVIGRSVIEPWH